MKKLFNFFSLFGSVSTLVCCALPALFVSIGAGAAFASLLGHFPQLIWISEHKVVVFIFAGLMLACAGFFQWWARNEPCPIDPIKAKACRSSRRISLVVYLISVAVFLTGAGFSFLPELIFM